MTEAVIVSTARTPIGKAYRGGLNDTAGATLGGHAIEHALKRSGLDGGEIEDVVMGCAMQEGATGLNVARRALLAAGLPVTVAGTTIDRQCSSGLQSMALLANAIRNDGVIAGIAGGLESISLVQNDHRNTFRLVDEAVMAVKPEVYMPMIDTAEVVAKRYGISRERQDEYGLESQRRVAAAREAGRFAAEIAPIRARMAVVDKETKEVSHREVEIAHDEGPRADTTAEGLAGLKPVREGGTITAGNASQLSDGASANVMMSSKEAEKRGLTPLAHAASLDAPSAVTALWRAGADINAPCRDGRTALHLAVEKNDERAVQRLLRLGAHINQTDKQGQTPLFEAAAHKNAGMIDLLTSRGARIDHRDTQGRSIADWAIEKGADALFVDILAGYGAPFEPARTTRRTPLHRAAAEGRSDLIDTLLLQGISMWCLVEIWAYGL
mgnify:CR=1 FL=1